MTSSFDVREAASRDRSGALRFQIRRRWERIVRDVIWSGFRLAEGSQRRLVRLDEAGLLQTARRRAGVGEFGDTGFLQGLRCLLRSLETESQLNLFGRMTAREDILHLLVNRLRVERDRERRPEIAAQKIRRPIFVTGLPRSGSTLLHRLLAQDPANRVPQSWEMFDPSPPPERASYDSDPRIAATERRIRWFHLLAPEFRRIHESGARLPEECIMILAHSFIASQFCSMFGVPSYQTWLNRQDLVPAYRLHKRFLQHLQSRCPGERWALKAPTHLLGLGALLKVYPDACLILTHREPLEVLASEASLQASLRGIFCRKADPAAMGREATESLARAIDRGLQALDQGCASPDQVFDLHYPAFMKDPIGTLRRIYAHFGLPFRHDLEVRARGFLDNYPKDLHGPHRYSLGQFGLVEATERERYAAYRARFGL